MHSYTVDQSSLARTKRPIVGAGFLNTSSPFSFYSSFTQPVSVSFLSLYIPVQLTLITLRQGRASRSLFTLTYFHTAGCLYAASCLIWRLRGNSRITQTSIVEVTARCTLC
jgi:hypothetical protein